MHIPKEIQYIILNYLHEFNQVEDQIGQCLDHYFAIEHRATRILDKFCDRVDCPLHRKELRVRIKDIVQEAGRIVSTILDDQTVLPVQKNLFVFLMSELTVDSFNLFLMPLPPLLEPFQYESYEHHNANY
jgi:hypothetical protein